MKEKLPLAETAPRELIEAEYVLVFCTKPIIMKELTLDEKSRLRKLSEKIVELRKDLTQEDLGKIRQVLSYLDAKYADEMGKGLPEVEIAELDALLRSNWDAMREALAQNDIDKAISYFSDSAKANCRKFFSSLTEKQRASISRNLSDIQLIRVIGNSAEYDIRTIRDGNKYSHHLLFVKDYEGGWKIRSF